MQLHSGAYASLRLILGDELDIAEMIRDGDLPSPWRVGHYALFKIRITGVGYAYRPKHDEWVYRRPQYYLTERFLQRCNGLFVIWEHPADAVLDSQEFAKRFVGTVTLPFIEGDEVWAIARIADKTAMSEMAVAALSTSPSVVFLDPSVNLTMEAEDGTTLLIEGPASRLDHVAICRNGVWDKDEGPTGIVSEADLDDLDAEAFERVADSVDEFTERMDILQILHRLEGGARAQGV